MTKILLSRKKIGIQLGAGIALGFLCFWPVQSIANTQKTSVSKASSKKSSSMKVTFQNVEYTHRWSDESLHEFTPVDQPNLDKWTDMISINVRKDVTNEDQLAGLANGVLETYKKGQGKILKTNSKPKTATSPAEHFMAAVFGTPLYLEAVATRLLMHEGTGITIVSSHRIYGKSSGQAMSEWLSANGNVTETALMEWKNIPKLKALQSLPKSEKKSAKKKTKT